MAAGEARRIHAETGKPVCIVDRFGRPIRQEVWKGTPYIADYPGNGAYKLKNCGGHRPYIKGKTERQWFWNEYKPIPARLFLTTEERQWERQGTGKVILGPSIKRGASPNKAWPHERWIGLAERLRHLDLGQFPGDFLIPGVPVIQTPSIRCAGAVLRGARAAVVHEGGLHHMAAAMSRPAVVIYGGFISPAQTGYDMHANLFTGGEPCGMRVPCDHCRQAMDAITIDMVAEALAKILEGK